MQTYHRNEPMMSLREGPSYKKTSRLGKEQINSVASWKNIQENVMIHKVLRKVCCILAMA